MTSQQPHGASPVGAPNRRATILRGSYFLDRFLVALATVLASIVFAFGVIQAIGLRNDAIRGRVSERVINWTTMAEIEQWRIDLMHRAYPFDPFAPIYEQFAQFTVNVLTWPPIAVALLGCPALAVAARRYAY